MSRMMLHGLGDCTPAQHCGCLTEEESRSMARKLTREEVIDTIEDALDGAGVVYEDEGALRETARAVFLDLDAEGVIDDREVE